MNEIEIYTAQDGKTELEVRFEGETVWLTQEQIAAVFGTQRPAITKHLKNVFASGELDEQVVSSILEHTTKHGAIAGKTQIKKKNGYSYQEMTRLSGVSMGGLIGLRKNTMISPNVATKLAEVFGYENWQDMLEDFHKKERRKAKPAVSKDWKEAMEARVAELEKELNSLKK